MAAKILNVDEAKLVRAAGGIIRRNGTRGPMRVVIVHRPGYDDWSFPKGKVDRGESLEATALREVEEETGLRCKLVAPLGCTAYSDHKGREKVAVWLKHLENRSRHGADRNAPMATYDFTWLWRELKVEHLRN